jgi:GntR family transcriptional regulator
VVSGISLIAGFEINLFLYICRLCSNKGTLYFISMTYSIDHYSPVPLHAQVEELLRQMITETEYIEGKMLPNEVDLAKTLGISRNTLRQAMHKLMFEGLLVRKKGIGTRVASKTVTTRLNYWPSFTREMKEKGFPVINFDIHATKVPADEQLSQLFGIKLNTPVVKLERLRGLKDGPMVQFISYFHPRIGLTGDEDFTRPLNELLEKDFSTVVVLSREEISAQLATRVIAEKLGIKKGDAVLKRIRRVYDPGERIVEYNICLYRADKFTYLIDIHR